MSGRPKGRPVDTRDALEEATRAARGTLKDIGVETRALENARRELASFVDSATETRLAGLDERVERLFAARVDAAVARAEKRIDDAFTACEKRINREHDEYLESIAEHLEKIRAQVDERLAYLALLSSGNNGVVATAALEILMREPNGTKFNGETFHVLKETRDGQFALTAEISKGRSEEERQVMADRLTAALNRDPVIAKCGPLHKVPRPGERTVR